MEIKFLEKGNNLCLHSEGSGREGLSSLPDFFPVFAILRRSDTVADYGHQPEIKKLLILLKILPTQNKKIYHPIHQGIVCPNGENGYSRARHRHQVLFEVLVPVGGNLLEREHLDGGFLRG